jgi:hypothetical protein
MKREDSKDKLSSPATVGESDDTPDQTPVTTAPTSPISSGSESRPTNTSKFTDNVSPEISALQARESDNSFYQYSPVSVISN